ncbi:MAG: methylthioribulose-1-phosphate dehydratase [Elusimicrobia bacterium RIFCSPLOWO2_02_FULL_39_32]|nr:MAG: methylthioribulose-1-phosphate dehydratase [Elusimicrobia bacterium GWA2_38_7]OGR79906.1 MAG: methylthioribulose-1-phosphate dehydratase [Elusimicrobia bacterium RIFCSPHIGHO2_02_FULL_39_36]OGR93441.1 MAG: methylthioribulose-1-phosphate dehydratase [Elusimicrobia bacterium RIFCSPLOWO2_02_FULL_39_32]OGS00288.1 MAG: methylthioribulose-1-phosphate dehydratase [Elusimicrobia bacterium RIFCSPLOWO2_12_FULL_39_28]
MENIKNRTIESLMTQESASSDQEIRRLICELCQLFYFKGWASGTGGGISIRQGEKIYMAPSGVQKEQLDPNDIFVLDLDGNVLEEPVSNLKCSECKPLFILAYHLRNAGAVLHSHSIHAMTATWLYDSHFKISNLEMQKGIIGANAFDTVEVPIIPNMAKESDLTDSLRQAILENPKTHAVLVRGHGVYVWGKDWIQAKTQAECYDYLFEAAIKLKHLGIDLLN